MTESRDFWRNRRSFQRMEVETDLSFHRENEPSRRHSGWTRDLSADGVQFETEVTVVVGERLYISVTPADGRLPPLTGSLQVVRVDETSSGNIVVAGELTIDNG